MTPSPPTPPEEDRKSTAVQPLLYGSHLPSTQQGREEPPRTPTAPTAAAPRHKATVPSQARRPALLRAAVPRRQSATAPSCRHRSPARESGGARGALLLTGWGGLMPERGTAFQRELLGEEERRDGKAPPRSRPGVTEIPPLPRAFHAWSAGTPPGATPHPLAPWAEKQNKRRFTVVWGSPRAAQSIIQPPAPRRRSPAHPGCRGRGRALSARPCPPRAARSRAAPPALAPAPAAAAGEPAPGHPLYCRGGCYK